MRERPILFSSAMVKAILDGKKQQTRREIKPQPISFGQSSYGGTRAGWTWKPGTLNRSWNDDDANPYRSDLATTALGTECPYGKVGDRLWVRETYRLPVCFDDKSPGEVAKSCLDAGYLSPWCPVRYEADGYERLGETLKDGFGGAWGKTRVSIHMPRWASRITLEITGVRVERLHDISEEDAIAEGVTKIREACYVIKGFDSDKSGLCHSSPITPFQKLWCKINGEESWDANPWLWVVSFKRV